MFLSTFVHFSEKNGDERKIRASLVFKNVSKEDLQKNYSCKLDSAYQTSVIVTITLAPKGMRYCIFISCIIYLL